MLITEGKKVKYTKHCLSLQSQLKWKIYTKVIKMPSRMAFVQRPSGLIFDKGSARHF